MNSAYRFIGTGFIAVGSAIGGFIAKGYDYAAPFTVGGVIMIVALVVGVRPIMRHAARLGV